jgi:hypothetical protein
MQQIAVETYLKQLTEIKQRGNVFLAFSRGNTNALYEETTLEVAAFQLRKILELLAFGFVLATGEKAIPAYISFIKYKKCEDFFIQLKTLNENFFPQPIIQKVVENGEIQWIYPKSEEYLTSQDFAKLFEYCDKILEPRQFNALPISLETCKVENQIWFNKITRLIDAHLIHPDGDEITYLFQMCSQDVEPTCTPFKTVSENVDIVTSLEVKPNKVDISIKDHLRRQLEFLRRSCEIYDAGNFDEAIRLAVGIRVLLHDTNKSKSVLSQMKVKEQLLIATSFGFSSQLPKNFQASSIIPIFASSGEGGTSVPFSLPMPLIFLKVNEWLDETVWMQDSSMTREKIILQTANKEGGAHVEAKPTESIQELRKGLTKVISVKINGVEVGSPKNYHFTMIRQFAHELLSSDSLTILAQ